MESIHDLMYRNGLVRSQGDKMIGGVCSGLARRLGIEAGAMRLLFVFGLLCIPGSQVLVYPLLWALMPDESYVPRGSAGPMAPPAGPAAGAPPAAR